jgi:hypothetical protein
MERGAVSSGIRKSVMSRRKSSKRRYETMRGTVFGADPEQTVSCFGARFLAQKYSNEKTLIRYQGRWSAIFTFLSHRNVIAPAQVTYQLLPPSIPLFESASRGDD